MAVRRADQGCLRCYLQRERSSTTQVVSRVTQNDEEIRHRKLSRRVISTVLYGDNPRYTVGAVRNAQLLPVVFPEWRLRIYVHRPNTAASAAGGGALTSVPQLVLDRLLDLGVELIYVDADDPESIAYRLAPMLWRFLVVDDPNVDIFLSRDVDSRLIERDAAAVSNWIGDWSSTSTNVSSVIGRQSRQHARNAAFSSTFHCIRDHPSHGEYPVNGGMWGAVRHRLAGVLELDSAYLDGSEANRPPAIGGSAKGGATIAKLLSRYGDAYMEDMRFMETEIWSRLLQTTGKPSTETSTGNDSVSASGQNNIRCHDSVSCDRWPGAVSFPLSRLGTEHVGQVFDARSVPRRGDVDLLVAAEQNRQCEPQRVLTADERDAYGASSSC